MGRLTLPRLRALYRYWRRHPPTHRLLSAFMGYEPPADADDAAESGDDLNFDQMPGWMASVAVIAPAPNIAPDASRDETAEAFLTLFYGQMTNVV